MVQAIAGQATQFDDFNYKVEAIYLNARKYKLVHGGMDRDKDLVITAKTDETLKQVNWDVEDGKQMPQVLSQALASCKFFDLKRYTYSCLLLSID